MYIYAWLSFCSQQDGLFVVGGLRFGRLFRCNGHLIRLLAHSLLICNIYLFDTYTCISDPHGNPALCLAGERADRSDEIDTVVNTVRVLAKRQDVEWLLDLDSNVLKTQYRVRDCKG